jgi:hypothetical protein
MTGRIESLVFTRLLMGFLFDPGQELAKFLTPDQPSACLTGHHEL